LLGSARSDNNTFVTASGKNIVQLAQSVPDLPTLVTALTAGKLTTALSNRLRVFAVFAPTNEAALSQGARCFPEELS
jgi:uncharacterized surface protein with fasciclin (FAS1) repeats